jgi:Zn-dependent M28 family amino/carboxypeptidase
VLKAIQDEISAPEIAKTLNGLDYDRVSGAEGEQKAFAYLEQRLREFGVRYKRYDHRAYLSWPVRGQLVVYGAEPMTFQAVTPAFGVSTPPGGVTAEIVVLPDRPEGQARGAAAAPLGANVRGKIVVASGSVSPDTSLRVQRAGAAGLIQIADTETIFEMIATTIWGTPTTESANRIPTLPIISIKKSEGDRLRAAAGKGSVTVTLTAEVKRGWASIPIIVAEVPGKSPDYLFVATHVDAWYRGMTDTAGSVASILDMARVLEKHRAAFERGIRFCWWSGHSYGRYPGSTWYVDHFWGDLDEHAVAYTNLDGPGRRGSKMDEVYARGWPGIGEYSQAFAQRLTGKTVQAASNQLFRPGRDSDSSFQGLGIPEFEIGVPGPGRGHSDVQPSGRIDYWHTARDTLDKLDIKALELDTRYRVAQLYDLATMRVLPHKLAPIATSYVSAIDELAKVAGTTFDFTSTRATAQKLVDVAARFDAAPRPTSPSMIASFNRLVVRLTHRLNSTLYTKAGRFDQDPAASMPVFPLLARAGELPVLLKDSDTYGFLETELFRGRNAVEATLREATEDITSYLAKR